MNLLHDWNLTPREAIELQNRLRSMVSLSPPNHEIHTIAGADISFNRFSNEVYAGIIVLSLPDLKIIDRAGVHTTAQFPYVPGLLSFRESPPLLEAWEKLKIKPDLLVLDGQGTAHPRRFGIACHMGLLLDLPTIGCAKSLLTGKFDQLNPEAGSRSPLIDKDEVIGTVLRTKNKVSPVYISPGHLTDIDSSVEIISKTITRYRIPEPTRQAHIFVNNLRKNISAE